MEDYTESDHQRDLCGTITDDDASSARYGTPHEPKRKASVTPKGRSSHMEFSMLTPERRTQASAESSPPHSSSINEGWDWGSKGRAKGF